MAALEHWPRAGQPQQPPAWLYRVASNHLLGELRKERGRQRLLDRQWKAPIAEADELVPPPLEGEVEDDLFHQFGDPEEGMLAAALSVAG